MAAASAGVLALPAAPSGEAAGAVVVGAGHHAYRLQGVDVVFPFDAYACQKVYMERVIACLQAGGNALLESPTGTGKTLCLLCAALAWRQTYQAWLQAGRHGAAAPDLEAAATSRPAAENLALPAPKIIFSSRTHSQLSQAVRELRRAQYPVQVCLLGSREQMCIHPEVVRVETTNARNQLCRQRVAQRACEYKNHMDPFLKEEPTFLEPIRDIEELVEAGRQHRVCPYYLARDTLARADVLFAPYNYLVDPATRKAQGIDISNSVIIFDEAHNLESTFGEVAAFELTGQDLALCLAELDKCVVLLENTYDASVTLDVNDIVLLKALLLDLESNLYSLALPMAKSRGSASAGVSSTPTLPGRVEPGSFIFRFLEQVKLTPESHELIGSKLADAVGLLVAGQETERHADMADGERTKQHRRSALQHLHDGLESLFSDGKAENTVELDLYYRVYVQETDTTVVVSQASKTARSISFWCFNSGVAMRELLRQGVRSVILTSGTLAPLPSLAAELQTEFRFTLENTHVIGPHQVWAGVMPTGPSGVTLNASFKTRGSDEYRTDLGNSIVNFCQVIPDGVLVFFPSYGVMADCVQAWQVSAVAGNRSVWDRLKQYKHPVIEPRRKQEFADALEEFYERADHGGSVLFAVCRGKVSEGIDFADAKARAVIITGMPYPALTDPKVLLKRNFLDELNRRSARERGDWYRQQAARTVNQAIGRVIRHRNDFGAIILCDERFAHSSLMATLPMWVRPFVTVFQQFGEAQGSLVRFFKRAAAIPELQPKPRAHITLALETAGTTLAPVAGSSAVRVASDAGPRTFGTSAAMTAAMQRTTAAAGPERVLAPPPPPAARGSVPPPPPPPPPAPPTLSLLQQLKQASTAASASATAWRPPQPEPPVAIITVPVITVPAPVPLSSPASAPAPSGPAAVPATVPAKQFVSLVKEVLSADHFKEFTKLLLDYRASRVELATLLERLWRLLPTERQTEVLIAFQPFVVAARQSQYETFCRDRGVVLEPRPAAVAIAKPPRPVAAATSDAAKPPARQQTLLAPLPPNRAADPPSKPAKRPAPAPKDATTTTTGVVAIPAAAPKRPRPTGADPDDPAPHAADGIRESTERVSSASPSTPAIAVDDDDDATALVEPVVPAGAGTAAAPVPVAATPARCCVCHDRPQAPFASQCGHIACFLCWREALAVTLACPKCHQKTRMKQLTKLYFL